ncbi:Formate hydrogenlyase maturation protein hycH [Photobacterium marinum]|uniref:Formate hydrogenlyase maturation protein hycH n=1 Tax=Photobacterium marinum TaxID=1056511 RepID=L8J4T2_9GAMM|nr:formate hydrogenlyase maturation HycH family protein [Photobacterium marinum]ELR63870.1 Formate hydrogenlyase maturation protein hycH [Photobacterium marinum]
MPVDQSMSVNNSGSVNKSSRVDKSGFTKQSQSAEQSGSVAQSRHLDSQVYFYSLSRKFVDESEVPEEARQIMYYSLAIGHHLGVVDCLDAVLQCSGKNYLDWICGLPLDSEAYRKMYGFLVFGEITIYAEHINMLACAFDAISAESQSETSQRLTKGFIEALTAIYHEPSMYMMIRSGK